MQPPCAQHVAAGESARALSGPRHLRTESCERYPVWRLLLDTLLIVVVLAALLLPGTDALSLTASDTDRQVLLAGLPRIRTTDADIAEALREGQQLSATFRQLVDALRHSNVVVYLERHNRFREDEAGRLRLTGAAGGLRYVHVSLSTGLTERELIVYIAHELAHAVEIARAGHVVDSRGVSELYCRIGFIGPRGFDTDAAQRVTEIVGDELSQSPDR